MRNPLCPRQLYVCVAVVIIVSVLLPAVTRAQGESAVPFLLIAPSSRASAMGESGAGLADDASAVFWNPAGLAFQRGWEVSITHAPWLPQFQMSDLFYDYLSARYHLEDIGGTIGANITYLSLGKFVQTSSAGPEPIGEWKGYEYAIAIGYGTKISADLALGINMRFINSHLADFGTEQEKGKGTASTVSGDIAFLYRPQSLVLPLVGDIGGGVFSVGMNLSNLGPKLTYIDAAQADPLPTNLRLGFAFGVIQSEYNNLTWTLDFSRLLVRRHDSTQAPDPFYKALITAWSDNGLKKVILGTGLEYWYGNPKLFALRLGYFYEHPDFGNRKFMTFGAGIRYDIYGADFSYISAPETSPLASTVRFSLLISWGVGEDKAASATSPPPSQ